jgi:hypothetical protein
MERVTVRTYLETQPLRTFGAHYELANSERVAIASGERSSQHAKDKATAAIYELEWEAFQPDRADGFIEIGHGWIDC